MREPLLADVEAESIAVLVSSINAVGGRPRLGGTRGVGVLLGAAGGEEFPNRLNRRPSGLDVTVGKRPLEKARELSQPVQASGRYAVVRLVGHLLARPLGCRLGALLRELVARSVDCAALRGLARGCDRGFVAFAGDRVRPRRDEAPQTSGLDRVVPHPERCGQMPFLEPPVAAPLQAPPKVYREVGATALFRAPACFGDPAKDVQWCLLGLEIEHDNHGQADADVPLPVALTDRTAALRSDPEREASGQGSQPMPATSSVSPATPAVPEGLSRRLAASRGLSQRLAAPRGLLRRLAARTVRQAPGGSGEPVTPSGSPPTAVRAHDGVLVGETPRMRPMRNAQPVALPIASSTGALSSTAPSVACAARKRRDHDRPAIRRVCGDMPRTCGDLQMWRDTQGSTQVQATQIPAERTTIERAETDDYDSPLKPALRRALLNDARDGRPACRGDRVAFDRADLLVAVDRVAPLRRVETVALLLVAALLPGTRCCVWPSRRYLVLAEAEPGAVDVETVRGGRYRRARERAVGLLVEQPFLALAQLRRMRETRPRRVIGEADCGRPRARTRRRRGRPTAVGRPTVGHVRGGGSWSPIMAAMEQLLTTRCTANASRGWSLAALERLPRLPRRLHTSGRWGRVRGVRGRDVVSEALVDRVRGMTTIPQPNVGRAAQFKALRALGPAATPERPAHGSPGRVDMTVRPLPAARPFAPPSDVTIAIPLDAIPAVQAMNQPPERAQRPARGSPCRVDLVIPLKSAHAERARLRVVPS